MALEQTGVLFKKYPVVSGTSKAGKQWEKQDFLIEQGDKYKNYIKFSLFGEKTSLITRISEGETVKVEFYVGCQGSAPNGEYYNNVNAVNVDVVLDNGNESYKPQKGDIKLDEEEDDQLPF